MTYGCAACFSPRDDGTVTLPFDLETGELIPERVGPLAGVGPGADGAALRRRAARPAGDLHRRRADEWYLDLGAKAVVEAAPDRRHRRHFELFDATHTAIDYRYPAGLKYLATSDSGPQGTRRRAWLLRAACGCPPSTRIVSALR